MKILICGGAGYIGSHMALYAGSLGHRVHVIDNLSTGHAAVVPPDRLFRLDIGNLRAMQEHLEQHHYDLVMHFCANSLVGESVADPAKYYRNNVASTLALLQAMLDTGHRSLVFSSTAAVYGTPETAVISEDHPKHPINPYGRSKWMIEQILQDYHHAYGLNSVSLRYFNAAGAEPEGRIGELHDPETHLIPNVLRSIAHEDGPRLQVFGNDYPTRDGTCERDYIHVFDLASAHLLAGQFLAANPGAHHYNLGNGVGYTILEIIRAAEKVSGKEIPFDIRERRPGDPPTLVADIRRATRDLGWQPEYTDVEQVIGTAWNWHRHESFSLKV